LRLIDYDGAYIGELAGRKAEVIGSPAYQHPSRDADFFGKAIDDYPIALISLSLHALALDPSLFGRYHDGENIIFDAAEVNRGKSALFDRLMREWARCGASVGRSGRLDAASDAGSERIAWVVEGFIGQCAGRIVGRDRDSRRRRPALRRISLRRAVRVRRFAGSAHPVAEHLSRRETFP